MPIHNKQSRRTKYLINSLLSILVAITILGAMGCSSTAPTYVAPSPTTTIFTPLIPITTTVTTLPQPTTTTPSLPLISLDYANDILSLPESYHEFSEPTIKQSDSKILGHGLSKIYKIGQSLGMPGFTEFQLCMWILPTNSSNITAKDACQIVSDNYTYIKLPPATDIVIIGNKGGGFEIASMRINRVYIIVYLVYTHPTDYPYSINEVYEAILDKVNTFSQ